MYNFMERNQNFTSNLFICIGNMKCVEILIQNGADIESKDVDKVTPLEAAVSIGLYP